MARLSNVCPGDCSRCQLLQNGEVEMVPCILDQIFQKVQKQEKVINDLSMRLAGADADKQMFLASVPGEESEEEVLTEKEEEDEE